MNGNATNVAVPGAGFPCRWNHRRCGDGAGSEAVYARATLSDDLHAGVGDRDAGPAVADTNADRRVIFLIESTDRCQN